MAKRKNTAILNPGVSVSIEYDANANSKASGERETREFDDAYAARRFYVNKDKAGRNPRVKAGTLPTEDAPATNALTTNAAAASPAEDRAAARAAAKRTATAAKAEPAPAQPAKAEDAAASKEPATPKTPGVSLTKTRYYYAAQIIKQHGHDAGVTDAMVAELDAAYADGKKANAVESGIALRNAWAAIRGWCE